MTLVTMFIIGCTGNKADISSLLAERDSMKAENLKQKQELEDLNAFVGTISNGLDSIAQKEGMLQTMGREGLGMTREQMKLSLSELSNMLARQRMRISVLEDSLKAKGNGVNNIHNIVAYLNDQLEAKEKVIDQLRLEVENKNSDIAKLRSRISTLNESVEKLDKKTKMQQSILATQNDILNECYMKIGTKKQLKQSGIINGKKINPSGLIPEKFVRVDIRQFRELTLNSTSPKILTSMPQGSYSITRNSDKTSTLTISNPTLFWSISNYLVITTD